MNPALSGSSTSRLLIKASPLDRTRLIPANSISKRYYYDIESKHKTSSAYLLFAKHRESKERVVIKILRRYQDTRYYLETAEERQRYQIEALHWNSLFAPQVYVGLARIRYWGFHQKTITLSEIILNPTKEKLDPKAEYALVMHALPCERRLDFLLKNENEISLQRHLRLLAEYVAYMHENLTGAPVISKDNVLWGSFEQLQKKLELNLALVNQLLRADENGQNSLSNVLRDIYSHVPLLSLCRRNLRQEILHYSKELKVSDEQKDTLYRLKSNLREIIRQYPYQRHFEERIQKQRIKRCHGDLKATHIWITSNYLFDSEPWKYASVIDAIDFNPNYCNIDILSDFAMLVLDIQARTKSSFHTNRFIEDYLRFTGQKDEIDRSVLAYYLIEKAIMWTAVSIIYDDLPELGSAILDIANNCIADIDTLFDISRLIITPGKTILDD